LFRSLSTLTLCNTYVQRRNLRWCGVRCGGLLGSGDTVDVLVPVLVVLIQDTVLVKMSVYQDLDEKFTIQRLRNPLLLILRELLEWSILNVLSLFSVFHRQ